VLATPAPRHAASTATARGRLKFLFNNNHNYPLPLPRSHHLDSPTSHSCSPNPDFNSAAMANPRQRSKARSHKSTKPSLNAKRRLHQKLRRKPTLNGPEVLQQGWDKHKTVFQK
jgi:hypothetical protein